MPTSQEQIDAATAKLDSLISTSSTEPAATEKVLSPAEAVASIATELGDPTKLSKERVTYLTSVLGEINSALTKATENNYEASSSLSSITIRVVDDPFRQPPPTRKFIDPTDLPSSGASSNSIFASNVTKTEKAGEIAKLLLDRDALKKFLATESVAKSAATDKLDEIISIFGLSDSDLKDTYEVRWKIGDLISLLQNQIKLERMLAAGGVETEKTSTTKAETTAAGEWPRDMANAKFDAEKQAYEKQPSRWND